MTVETGHVTGTKDKNYNLIWYTEKCLDNALRLETYIQDAERAGDQDVADLFRKAQSDSRKGRRDGGAAAGQASLAGDLGERRRRIQVGVGERIPLCQRQSDVGALP